MEEILKGVPASMGLARGKVRLISRPQDSEQLQDGEILVTEVTNPLFTIAMLKAAAIVTDVGGMLSHTAIVARELDIPCIVGTKEATKKLKTGMEVVVDGEKGVVFRE